MEDDEFYRLSQWLEYCLECEGKIQRTNSGNVDFKQWYEKTSPKKH